METISKLRWNGLVMWREEQTTVGKPALHSGHPGKTKNEMEERFREFRKTLSSCCAKRGTVEVNGEGLHPTTDIKRLKLELKLKVPAYFSIYIHVNKVY